jgi:DNA-binding NarL/FixJ family response regulator
MRVVIAEDSVLLRAGLELLLTDAGHEVVAAVDTAPALLAAITRHEPDLAIVDVRMPPTFTDEGVRAAVIVRAQNPSVRVLIANRTAGLGYLLKDRVADVDTFLEAVARVADGGTVLDPEVVAQLVVRSRRTDGLEKLTDREREVLKLIAEGRSNGSIADELVISYGSVEKHISSIFSKLDLPPEDSGHRRVLAVLRYLGSDLHSH